MDTIKIRRWEELDGKISPSKEFIISTIDECITINNYEEEEEFPKNVANIDTREAGELYTFAFLKAFGFSVEFIPEIKLTEQEYHQVRVYDDGIIHRSSSKRLWYSIRNPKDAHSIIAYELSPNLFPFIQGDDKWSIESLMKLEKES